MGTMLFDDFIAWSLGHSSGALVIAVRDFSRLYTPTALSARCVSYMIVSIQSAKGVVDMAGVDVGKSMACVWLDWYYYNRQLLCGSGIIEDGGIGWRDLGYLSTQGWVTPRLDGADSVVKKPSERGFNC